MFLRPMKTTRDASDSVISNTVYRAHWLFELSWGSVFGGCFVALSVHLLLTMLGVSLGVAIISLGSDPEAVPHITMGTGIAWTVSALVALWLGGWVAGRTAGHGHGNIGGLHGIVVWAVATVVTFLFISGTSGLLIGGAMKAVGNGLAFATKTVAAAGSAGAAQAMTNSNGQGNGANTGNRSIGSFLDEIGTRPANANSSGGNGQPAYNSARAKREV